jgi:hypothetical protein
LIVCVPFPIYRNTFNMSLTKEEEKAKGKVEEKKTVDKKTVLELLEEDDEFEEFEGNSWDDVAAQSDANQLWQDDWDDDNVVSVYSNEVTKCRYLGYYQEVKLFPFNSKWIQE